jgi:2,3-bisphosphoglycerate-independent phosphoglycerate mutase
VPPLLLLILDGWGVSPRRDHNAIALARTPHYHELLARFPSSTLVASGTRVGLPDGQMGNSEVGHTNMGAGRVVYQDLTRIDKAIVDGEFQLSPVLTYAFDRCRDQHAMHLIGLVSDGGVHSHINHAKSLIDMAKRAGVRQLYVHAITDGRDTSPNAGVEYLGDLSNHMASVGLGEIASVSGRYFAMDRDRRWDRLKAAYDVMVYAEGPIADDPLELLRGNYTSGITDEFIPPTVMARHGNTHPIRDGDSVLCFNFRADRVRQITAALALEHFEGFDRRREPSIHYTCLTEYDRRFSLPVVFPPQEFTAHLGETLANAGLRNLRLAETEKYAHVTYFFNCGIEEPYAGEDRLLIPSPQVATYDLAPAMSAEGIRDALIADLRSARHDVTICNFANADMVGHTGNLAATIHAVEVLDQCVGRIVETTLAMDGTVVLTADHGNCEQMWDAERNSPHTAHTSNPVPVILINRAIQRRLRDGGALCDVAPTILELLQLQQPKEMTGRSLLED